MTKRTHRRLWLTVAAFAATELLLPARPAAAEDLTIDEIVDRTNRAAYYQGDDGRARVKMTIYDSKGRKRVREMTVLRRDDPDRDLGGQKFYVYFHKPADVAKMVFIVHKKLEGDDDRWLYLPSLDLVKRIGASDERTSFVGSDFYYEDVSGRGTDEDKHVLTKTTKNYYVLEHTPKRPKSVEFASYTMYVHKKSFLPTKVEYFDSKGAAIRRMTVDAVKKVQGIHTVTKATMENLEAGTKTVVEYSDVKYDVDVPDKVFTERYLRRAPVKYLKKK